VQSVTDGKAEATTTSAERVIATIVALAVAAGLTTLCVLAWRLSLTWPMARDLPILMYLAMLWDIYDVAPHAGFFDMNLLGSYATYLGLGRLFGYEAASTRYADLLVYLSLAGASMLAMRYAGWITGCVAAALFGLVYLQYGPDMSLQREYLMLVPLVLAVAAATRVDGRRRRVPALLAGLGIGAAMTIKPQAAIAAIPIGMFLAAEAWRSADGADAFRRAATALGWMAAGMGIVLAILVAALAWLGVLDEFLDIAGNYLPLYGGMSGRHQVFEPGGRAHYVSVHWRRFGLRGAWWIAGTIGAVTYAAGLPSGDPRRRRVALFGGLAAAFAVYPVLAGKFWNYHWLPMVYWLVSCASLAIAGLADSRWRLLRWAGVFAFALMLLRTFPPTEEFGGTLAPRETTNATAEHLGDFLRARLRPGETVQPMDWTKGAVVHAMLLAGAQPATSFVYDFHFYHHVSDPYIRGLRARFLAELESSAPQFIIKSRFGPFPSGPDTNRAFPGFQRILREHYNKVAETLAYTVYERRADSNLGTGHET
jgi:hypothetical protein